MNLSIGIVGLPNVGKSTLFNALTRNNIPAENYPFTTIDPNHGVVPLIDSRLRSISEVENSAKVVYAAVDFVDIAGLVKGASKGEGLGNKFLGNIKEVSAIAHVIRGFENQNITHVENSVDPIRDIELINFELILKDIETVSARLKVIKNKARIDKKLQPIVDHLDLLLKHLEGESLGIDLVLPSDEVVYNARRELQLLTDKPVIYVVNVEDSRAEEVIQKVRSKVGDDKEIFRLDIKQEFELSGLEEDERSEFMKDLGLEKTGLESLAVLAYKALGLISYFTAGPMEARAWTIKKGTNAKDGASEIHTDISENFITAEVVNWKDFSELGGWVKAKEKGRVRLEGKTYIMQDGDVVLFKHNG